MTNVPPLAQTIAAATRAQQVAKARRAARRIVIIIAREAIIHGALPVALKSQDWGKSLNIEACALWLLGHNMRWLTTPAVDLALEWLHHIELTDHGMWPEQETIPYPAEALARAKEAA
jgi:hypothetical protein